jgi:hypothetical protein
MHELRAAVQSRLPAREWSRGDASGIDGQIKRVSIARVDGNAARVAGASTGSASDQGKAATVAASELGRERVSMERFGKAT